MTARQANNARAGAHMRQNGSEAMDKIQAMKEEEKMGNSFFSRREEKR